MEEEPSIEPAWAFTRRFLAGYASGICLVLVGHPFDTIKVRLQTDGSGKARRFSGAWGCVKETFLKEGVRGFYRGMAAPLVMTGTVNCLLFGMQFNFVAALEKIYGIEEGKFCTAIAMQAAVLSGAIIPLVVTPMEGIKARLQVQYVDERRLVASTATHYSGPLDCAKKVYRNLGLWNGIYRGNTLVMACRMSNWSYFGGYALANQYLVSNMSGKDNTDDKVGRSIATLMAGSFAGVSYWLSCYPLDVLKARIQAAPDKTPPKYPTIAAAARDVWATAGYRGFFAGFAPCALRAMPANAAAFAGFEAAMYLLP